jgi:hypothetical protein
LDGNGNATPVIGLKPVSKDEKKQYQTALIRKQQKIDLKKASK